MDRNPCVVDRGQLTFAALDEAIAAARHDPEAAQSLFNLLMWGRRDAECIRRTQALMTEVGIPSTWYHI
jgi:hypothetical protein